MTAVGLIAEYNPFHNGHRHHLQECLKVSGAGVAVAVMSGHFLQRGMPAMLDKWVRTKMALAAGVDVVLELPVVWACNSAPHFADGAVALLEACGGVESLCFGSESGELAPLQECAALLNASAGRIAQETGQALRTGISYPVARAAAMQEIPGAAELLATPNNILGINYLQALAARSSSLRPLTIPRIGAGYHDCIPHGEIASATGIRSLYSRGEDLSPFIPLAVLPHLQAALQAGKVLDLSRLFPLLMSKLSDEPAALAAIYQVEDGIAERLCQQARFVHNLAGLIDSVKVRHLTVSRLQRILSYILLNLTTEEVQAQLAGGPPYLRLLGATARGEHFLASTRKKRTLPLLANLSRSAPQLKKFYGAESLECQRAMALLRLEVRATRLYTLLLAHWSGKDRNQDYFEAVCRVGDEGRGGS
ncbi:MAG: nucleotidyltransferase [Deltaproteobacteria bacterium HGW-Deltaproteobacteria-4]|nr:MAG: nucleotidyltransferase [Deltaproteobacteria bacterium HGW-Deltaproteobacteria-4]